MKRYIQQIQDLLKKWPPKVQVNRKLVVFSFFLLISTVFWFLRALEEKYTTEISYPVKFFNIPKGKVVVGELPSYLTARVNGYGFVILRDKLSALAPLKVNVQSLDLRRSPKDTSQYFTMASSAEHFIQEQLSDGLDIVGLKPDSLLFYFATQRKLKLPVQPVLQLDFRKQYMQRDELVLSPDCVWVSGASSLLDTMQVVRTEMIALADLHEDYQGKVRIQEFDGLEYGIAKIEVKVPVERFTEHRLKVPVEVLNLPDTLKIKLFPSTVNVSLLVGLSRFDNVKPEYFKTCVVFDTNAVASAKLQVEIKQSPGFVRAVKVYPQKLDYVVEKRFEKHQLKK